MSEYVREQRIKILGHNYKLLLQRGFYADYDLNPDRDIGKVNHITQEITIDPDVEGWMEVLLHEVLHCVDRAMFCDLTEEDISRMSQGLFCMLKDNGWLREDLEQLILE